MNETENRTGLSAVVAAAGLSSRMGAFKPLLPFDGATVIRRCVEHLRQAGAAEIVVVVGHRGDEIAEELQGTGADIVFNPSYRETQMFDSLCLGLKALRAPGCRVLLTPGDVPYVSGELIRSLTERDADFVCPCYGGRRGHPAALASKHIPALLAYGGAGGLRGAAEHLGLSVEFVDTPEPGAILDLDTPEDYQKLLHLVQEK